MMTRENGYKFTREDVLRELELLPVWKLRVPLPATSVAESLQPDLVANADTESRLTQVEPIENGLVENVAKTSVLVFSEDKKWAFVLPAVLTGQSAELFNNILRALKIKPTQTAPTQQLAQDIADSGVNVVVAMGEIAAQLLTSTQSIENLRGKMHVVNGVQVIATYHPDNLLQHLPNKAKAWDDLCMALSVLNA